MKIANNPFKAQDSDELASSSEIELASSFSISKYALLTIFAFIVGLSCLSVFGLQGETSTSDQPNAVDFDLIQSRYNERTSLSITPSIESDGIVNTYVSGSGRDPNLVLSSEDEGIHPREELYVQDSDQIMEAMDAQSKGLEHFKGILTFDDGPHPSTTPTLVKALVDAGVREVVFYFVGYRMLEYPELVASVVDAGYSIGYHSMFHQNLVELSTKEIIDDIRHFKKVANEVLGYDTKLVIGRPPFGGMTVETVSRFHQLEKTGSLATMDHDDLISQGFVSESIVDAFEAEGLDLMLWNIDFDDWEQQLDIDHAISSHLSGLRQVWLLHERPVDWRTYRTFDNQLSKNLPILLSALEARESSSRRATELVWKVQEKLSKLGYKTGPADGLVGEMTRAAITRYQQSKSGNFDGKVSMELLMELDIELKKHQQFPVDLRSL